MFTLEELAPPARPRYRVRRWLVSGEECLPAEALEFETRAEAEAVMPHRGVEVLHGVVVEVSGGH